MIELPQFAGFDWDDANDTKSWTRHRVTREECEEVFFGRPLLLLRDRVHSDSEERFYLLGQTTGGRFLTVVFTPRRDLVRVISARDMTAAERRRYHEVS